MLSILRQIHRQIVIFVGRYLSANQVTLVRFLVAMVMIPVWLTGDLGWQWLTAVVWGICWYADYIDGSVARLRGQITDTGKRADPWADKGIVFFTLLAFKQSLSFSVYLVVVILDIISTIEREVKNKKGEVRGANWFGKFKLICQVVAIYFFVLQRLLSWPYAGVVAHAFLLIAIILAILSLIKRFSWQLSLGSIQARQSET